MNVSPRRPLFNRPSHSNVYRMFFWTLVILASLWVVYGVKGGEIKPIGLPTPTPTREAVSFEAEGSAHFTAGELAAAITAYQKAIQVDPSDAHAWAEMARIQTYSSALTTTDEDKKVALLAALDSIDRAKALAPDDSTVLAIRAFVLDWNANPVLFPDKAADLLLEAEQEATHARQLDPQNALALAYNAEILIDQQKLAQAEQLIQQALEHGQDQMDVHRVYAYLLESEGAYNEAIKEYEKAIELTPNLTFLYLSEGANYRRLAFSSTITQQQNDLYEQSLINFQKAAKINDQLKVKDPIPYLSISKTYSQMGEYFIAGRNVQKALDFRPTDADIYGQLGIIFFKSRNYEGAIPALKCAVRGCTPPESCEGRYGRACDAKFSEAGVEVKGLPLSPNTVVYYYTYGSVMAALSRPKLNYCPEAMKVFAEVRAAFGGDTTIMSIVQDGETICQSIGLANQTSGVPTPVGTQPASTTATATPGMTETPGSAGYP